MSSEDLSSRRVHTDAYDLDDVLPVEGVASVDPGTNVLVSGARMLGKERLALETSTFVPGSTEATPSTGRTSSRS